MPLQLYKADLGARHTYSSIENTLHGNGRVIEQSIILPIKKASEPGGDDLMCYVLSLEDAGAHISLTHPDGILMIEK